MDNIKIHKTSILNGKPKLISSKYSKIIIGKYCAIAEGLKIITLNHDYNFPALQGTFYKKNFNSLHPGEINNPPTKERTKGDVIIGNDVWIGEDVLILSGVTIGSGCCIAAKSVITKSLPPYSICAGVPCKPVKQRYNKEIIKFLLDLNWWDWDNEKIQKNKRFFISNLNDIGDVNRISNIIK
jgi:acetyltransferase-like isoleucine patch superfamily enzyme